jgi:hypothetical protein
MPEVMLLAWLLEHRESAWAPGSHSALFLNACVKGASPRGNLVLYKPCQILECGVHSHKSNFMSQESLDAKIDSQVLIVPKTLIANRPLNLGVYHMVFAGFWQLWSPMRIHCISRRF